jgi:predicted dehydrogenase
MSDEISVGLIGYGMAARVFHAPVITSVPGLRLKTVVERRGDESRRRYPWVSIARDVGDVLEDEEISLVVVATPNASHFDLAQRALRAGKHVVVEKPFTTSSEQARRLRDLARSENKLISVFHNRRWDGDFLTVKSVLEEKLLGRLVEYESHFDRYRNDPRPNAWREEPGPGSGILFDLGSHLIDQARVLFGLPLSVTADVRAQRDFAKADDSFELILHYDNLKATLKAGMLRREPGPRFLLHGVEGSFVKYGLDPQEEALKRGAVPTAPNWGEEPREQWGALNTQLGGLRVLGRVETHAGDYSAFYRNVADALKERDHLIVTPGEAADTIRIIELAQQSSSERRTVDFSA